jgi:hypothetical protein
VANPKLPKKEIYAEIAKEMLNYGYNFSTDQCMERMKTLLTEYKETKDYNDKSGSSNKNWKYTSEQRNRPTHTHKFECIFFQ